MSCRSCSRAQSDERREGGRQARPVEGEREHLVPAPVEHRGLATGGLAKPHLVPLDGLVVGLPPGLAEPIQQQLGDVLEARRPVEVHEQRSDGHHGRRGYRSTERVRHSDREAMGPARGRRACARAAVRRVRRPGVGRDDPRCGRGHAGVGFRRVRDARGGRGVRADPRRRDLGLGRGELRGSEAHARDVRLRRAPRRDDRRDRRRAVRLPPRRRPHRLRRGRGDVAARRSDVDRCDRPGAAGPRVRPERRVPAPRTTCSAPTARSSRSGPRRSAASRRPATASRSTWTRRSPACPRRRARRSSSTSTSSRTAGSPMSWMPRCGSTAMASSGASPSSTSSGTRSAAGRSA